MYKANTFKNPSKGSQAMNTLTDQIVCEYDKYLLSNYLWLVRFEPFLPIPQIIHGLSGL